MMNNYALESLLNTTLNSSAIKDYVPNGLQIEGRETVKRIITGVTASSALIDVAIEQNADAILVHHGYFWKNESPLITGMKYRRIQKIIEHGINLYAYHLPLDLHKGLGNNAELGKLWQIQDVAPLSEEEPLIFVGKTQAPITAESFAEQIETTLNRTPFLEKGGEHLIERVAWCSGAAQDALERVALAGFDAFITGEVSERTVYIAREMGIHFYAAGHHATERYGVKALGEWLAEQYDLTVEFIDIDNPI